MSNRSHLMHSARRLSVWIVSGLLYAAAAFAPAQATEPAQDENLAYAIGVQTYINAFPVMDLYRTLWETSLDPGRATRVTRR